MPKVSNPVTAAADQMLLFPSTRYMGSKSKLLDVLWNNVKDLPFDSVLDAFSGSGCVGYMFKAQGKSVTTNDMLRYAHTIAKATIENNSETLSDDDIAMLLSPVKTDGFIRKTFDGLYFDVKESLFLERVMKNLPGLQNEHKSALALAALCRACIKKRPRGIFTYTGNRYDDGRKDLRLSMKEQFLEAIDAFNASVFDNGNANTSRLGDIFTMERRDFDLVYIDPPYFSTRSDNDYLRRYHFVEGLCSYWKNAEIDYETKTKKLKKIRTRFDSKSGIDEALDDVFSLFPKSIFVVSYSSNSLPTQQKMMEILRRHRKNVEVIAVDYKYSIGNQNHRIGNNKNDVQEFIFIAE